MTERDPKVTDEDAPAFSMAQAVEAHPVLGRTVIYLAVVILALLAMIIYKVIDLATAAPDAELNPVSDTAVLGQPAAAAIGLNLSQVDPDILKAVRPPSHDLVGVDLQGQMLLLHFRAVAGQETLVLVDLVSNTHVTLPLQ